MNLSTMNKQIIFVDSSVQDYQSLIQGIDPALIVILKENFSAIDQITNALADQKDIEAVHIVSHGSEGSLKLGADILNDNNLETFSDQLKQWGNALTANGDILLYGCDVAAGEVGENFVKRLSEITGADVAASTNKTGNAALGGDWELEKTTGAIEADLAFSDEALATYQSVLTPKNTAINLTGTGSVSIANSSTFNLTSAITVEASFKSNGFSKAWESIISKGDSSWRIARGGGPTGTGNSLEFALGTGAGIQALVGTTNVNDGQWHHVAAVYNGSTMSLYIDGVLQGTLNGVAAIPTNTFDVLIGANQEVTGRNFNGQIDEVRVWNTARTQAQIQGSINQNIDPNTAGLLGYWKFDEAVGTTAVDAAGRNNDGTLNSATWSSIEAPKTTTLQLNGSNSVSIANSSTFNLTSAITVEASFKSNGFSKAWESIISKGDSSWRIARGGGPTGTGNSLEFAIGTGGTQVVVGTTNVNDGQWHHVAAVYNGSTMSLYIDGVLQGTLNGVAAIPTNTFDVLIGANQEVTGRNFNGQIDEVRVWNTARTQAQIQGSINQNIDPNTAGLLGYWKFDEGAGVTASDISGTDNSGTLQNGATWVTDTIPPTVALTSAAAATVTAAFPVTATFSESTTNFIDTDITVTNGTVSGFSGTGTTYNFTVTPTGSGTVTVNIPANIATDAAGNNNTAATALTRTADTTAPTAASFSPADNATSVAVTADLVVTLSEAVQKGTGNIVIKKTDGTLVETIDVTTPNVTVSGSSVTINPLADLAPGTGYYVEIGAGAIKDLAGNNYVGIADATAWNFTTAVAVDTTAPTAASFSPADNATSVAVTANLVVTLNEAVQKGTGNIVIKKTDGTVVETIDVTTPNVTVTGSSVTINPLADLAPGTGYYVEIGAGAIKDLAGNNYVGIADATAWNFTTAVAVDTTAPTAASFSPADNATSVAVTANLVVTLNEAVQKG
ncbi:DUF4347 domain-containing protein, partial [Microcoleus sp. T2B6]|uniref:DUF4347 domain-containing protein n=1 Tax=Microcoleus sp. T2B6 TaxID=3055424 RepID=UPI002FD740E3